MKLARSASIHRPARAVLALFAAALLGAMAHPAAAAVFHGSAGQLMFHTPRVPRGPVIDGRLDDAVWEEAAVLDSFVQRDPIEGIRDTLGTQCLVLSDGENLYFGFRCHDRPGDVRAPVMPRDKILDGDWVGLLLDAYDDRQSSYMFVASPLGIQADGVDSRVGNSDFSPDFVFTSKGRLTADGYEVEMAIPYKSLRFASRDSLAFGLDVARNVARFGSLMFWAPITRNKNAYDQFGTMNGLTGIHPGRNLQLIPSFTGSRLGEGGAAGFAYDDKTRFGVSTLYGLTSGLTANAAITPDFSQVEADAGVLDINERFAIYFDEKRPFFLEGSEIFKTPIQLVYTRRIADPLYGLKITGKEGGTTIGVLQAMDRSAGLPVETLPDSVNPYRDRDASFTIARLRHDVFGRSSVGLLIADRTQRGSFNRDASVDANFNFLEHWYLNLQRAQSWVRDRDFRGALARLTPADAASVDPSIAAQSGAAFPGSATRAELSSETRRLGAGIAVLDVSRDFAADMGFIKRADIVDFNAWLNPRWFPAKDSWFNTIIPHLFYDRVHSHRAGGLAGRRTDEDINPELEIDMPRNTYMGVGGDHIYTLFNGAEFPAQNSMYVYAGSNRWKALQLKGTAGFGDGVIYDETVAGRGYRWNASVIARPVAQVEAELSTYASSLNRTADQSRFADQLIPRLRVVYLFNPRLSLRWISELQRVRYFGTSNALTSQSRQLSFDWLASYQTGPGTVFYAGFGSLLTGDVESHMKATSSSAFVKLSYLFEM